MKNMKMTVMVFLTAITAVFLPLQSLQAAEPFQRISYSLPSTTVSLSVEAVQEVFHAGPYAKYAGKYLGIKAKTENEVKYHIGKVSMTPYVEADLSARYLLPTGLRNAEKNLLSLSSSGLVILENGEFGNERVWRFPSNADGDFSDKGVNSNLKSESATLFGTGDQDNASLIQQEVTVGKSIEQKAKEAAEMVIRLRETRIQIITGDTDATYSGQAMESVLEELKDLEKEYLSLFTGYTEYQTQYANFDVIPATGQGMQTLIAFRLSDKEGLMPASTPSGRAVIMVLVPDKIAEEPELEESKEENEKVAAAVQPGEEAVGQKTGKKKAPKVFKTRMSLQEYLHYRVPVTCTVEIREGTKVLLQSRIPVYQMGLECTLPVK